MIKRMIQSVLCLFLCPLLTAQQVVVPAAASEVPRPTATAPAADALHPMLEFVTIPGGAEIKYVLLDAVSSANSKRGETIRCVVAEDVIVGGVTVLPAGTIVQAVITKVRRAVPDKHDGDLDFKPMTIDIGGKARLRITDSPESPGERIELAGGIALEILGAPLEIAFLPIALLVGDPSTDDKPFPLFRPSTYRHRGKAETKEVVSTKEVVFDPCYKTSFYTRFTKRVRVADLPAAPQSATAILAPCAIRTPGAATATP